MQKVYNVNGRAVEYEVSWSIKLYRKVTATSRQEAIDISYDLGDGGIDVDAYEMTPMKARRVQA